MQGDEQGGGEEDAEEHLLLFFIHVRSLRFIEEAGNLQEDLTVVLDFFAVFTHDLHDLLGVLALLELDVHF